MKTPNLSNGSNQPTKAARQPPGHLQLIAATTTRTGLKVRCELDSNGYPAGIKIADAELASVNLLRHLFHGEWNYTIAPRRDP